MAGKIIADQIEHSTAGSLDTFYVVNGSARQKHYYNQAANSIYDSFNVSSITDVQTSMYDPQATTAMSSVNYNIFAHAQAEISNSAFAYYAYNRATSSHRRYNYDNGARDLTHSDGMLFGDLA